MEESIYELADGDITKFEYVKKMKVSEASIIMLVKEIRSFKQWYSTEIIKEKNQ